MNKELAKEAKLKGNNAFEQKDYKAAIEHYTEAIKNDPSDHIFYSNRSACYACTDEFTRALEDGEKCIMLKTNWSKGYFRKGVALHNLKKYDDAIKAYEEGLKIDPKDYILKEALESAKNKKVFNNPINIEQEGLGSKTPFCNPQEIFQKLMSNPKTKAHMQDKDFMNKINKCQTNPALLV